MAKKVAKKKSSADALSSLKKKMADIQKKIDTEGKKFLAKAFKDVFKDFPILEKFSWNQYTPYFNDGDSCEFYANTDLSSLTINDVEGWDITQASKGKLAALKPAAQAVSAILQEIPQETLEELYGDGVEVVVTAKGVTIEDYDHD
jgi:hypothetical protein